MRYGALAYARTGKFDLLILDLGLPDRDGLDVLRELRRKGVGMPVIILTARDSVGDRVLGLDGGADDYITKPFRFEELLARVRVRLRVEQTAEPTVLRAGDAALDLRMRRAVVADRTVDLSAREFALAEVFFRHPGQVLSREQLLEPGLGVRLRPRLEHRRRLRRLSQEEARQGGDRERARDGVPARAPAAERRLSRQDSKGLLIAISPAVHHPAFNATGRDRPARGRRRRPRPA